MQRANDILEVRAVHGNAAHPDVLERAGPPRRAIQPSRAAINAADGAGALGTDFRNRCSSRSSGPYSTSSVVP
ncbi:MAG: hypothetical protein AB7O80_01830 [Acetobacteraceae bacterium]